MPAGQNPTQRKLKQDIEKIVEAADAAERICEWGEAIKHLKSAFEKAPQRADLLDRIGQLFLQNGDPSSADEMFRRSIRLLPMQGHIKYMLLAQLCGGREAVDLYRKGIEILRRMGDSTKDLGAKAFSAIAELFMTDLCDSENAEKHCVEAIQMALNLSPNNIHALQKQAQLYIVQGNIFGAKRNIVQVVERMKHISRNINNNNNNNNNNQQPPMELPSYDFRLETARILCEVGENNESKKLCDILIDEFDGNIGVWMVLKHIYTSERNKEKVMECLEKCIFLVKEQEGVNTKNPFLGNLIKEYENLKRC